SLPPPAALPTPTRAVWCVHLGTDKRPLHHSAGVLRPRLRHAGAPDFWQTSKIVCARTFPLLTMGLRQSANPAEDRHYTQTLQAFSRLSRRLEHGVWLRLRTTALYGHSDHRRAK